MESNKMLIPQVIEDKKGEYSRSYDIYSRLVADRIIYLGTEVCDQSANDIVAQLLYLDSLDHEKPISLYINSPGGSCTAGLAIVDTMNFIKAPVYTYCVGMAASMGAVILSSGEKGFRFATENSTIMTHMLSGGFQGNINDHIKEFEYSMKLNDRLNKILASNCGMPLKKYEESSRRDNFMFPEDALEFGIIDEVIPSLKNKKKTN